MTENSPVEKASKLIRNMAKDPDLDKRNIFIDIYNTDNIRIELQPRENIEPRGRQNRNDGSTGCAKIELFGDHRNSNFSYSNVPTKIEDHTMEATALFIATSLATALLSETAQDTYGALKAKLADMFNLTTEIAALEKNPGSEPYLQGLAQAIAEQDAAADQDITQLANALAEELKQHTPKDTRTAVLIEQIKDSKLEMGDINTEGSASVVVRNITEKSDVKIGKIIAKS